MTQGSDTPLKSPKILKNQVSAKDVWNQIRQAAQSGSRVLTVFDVDSTLFHVHTRHQAIIRRFFSDSENQTRFVREFQCIRDVEFQPHEWGIWEAFRRGGLSDPAESFQREIKAYWNTHFFSAELLKEDRPVRGAIEFVQKLHGLGVHIHYLTARPHQRMYQGTLETFQKWGLPLGERTGLFLKEDASVTDHEFKTAWCRQWRNEFDPVWLFENEPVNLQAVHSIDPDIELVFIKTVHSGLAEPPETAVTITHFEFEELFAKDR